MIRSICLMFIVLSTLPACSPTKDAAINACEVFIKERLRSPSTYKQVGVDYSGVTFKSQGRDVRMVTIEYDAANAYGTPIRNDQQCLFEVDSKGNYTEDPAHAASMSAIGAEEYTPCCLLDRKDKISDKSTEDDLSTIAPENSVELATEKAMRDAEAAANEVAQ